jgi:hypothetical protein
MQIKMQIINMTPHPINLLDENNQEVKTWPKGETMIRLSMSTVSAGVLPDGTPLTKTEYGDAEGLPEYQKDIYYIVSQLVKNALPNRTDLLVPAEMQRDDAGRIIGCRSLGV